MSKKYQYELTFIVRDRYERDSVLSFHVDADNVFQAHDIFHHDSRILTSDARAQLVEARIIKNKESDR